ncbi:HMGL-like-domain-containing protein [Nemania serpens]|nr:HMGL-like-domain-containing protein [Nemania serpens]
MPPSITHHTSHTMGNGASSSNSGCNSAGGASITHEASHAMETAMANTTGDGARSNVSGIVEASLTNPVADDDYYIPTEPSSRRSSVASTSHDDMDDSDAGTNSSGITTMSNSVNLARFSIIDSTLREGEQMATANFNTAQKLMIAQALDDFGVDYIELTSPAASPQSRADCEAICKLGLKAKVLCHIRCNMDDAKIAVSTGVDGINMCIGTSPQLMKHSHGKDLKYIAAVAQEVIEYVKSEGIEIRFSGEDSFRSDFSEILKLYTLVDSLGANRVGIADTVGGATPMEVYDKIEALRRVVSCDIETHFHNDTGCAIANAYTAVEAGATHIDTTVLGIGERNGITPLGGLIACLLPRYPEFILNRYKLEKLSSLEKLVAETVAVEIPFNNFVLASQGCD